MLYPAYIHKDEDSAYGAASPDFPGAVRLHISLPENLAF
jgi:predicted RNase H-like HicB family nuclease